MKLVCEIKDKMINNMIGYLFEGGFEGEIEFKDESDWGRVSLIGVHWLRPTESDLDDALYSAGRDGFDRIIIYI